MIYVKPLNEFKKYTPKKEDLTVAISDKEISEDIKTDFKINYQYMELGTSPAEQRELEITNPFDYTNHALPFRKLITDKAPKDIYIFSQYPDQEGIALALAISECKIYKGKFTEELLKTIDTPQFDKQIFFSTMGYYGEVYQEALKLLKARGVDTSKLTRYEVVQDLNYKEEIAVWFALTKREYNVKHLF